MTLEYCAMQSGGRTASKNLNKFRRQYSQVWVCKMSSGNFDWVDVETAASAFLPQIGTTTYPSDAGSLCVSYSASQGTGTQSQFFHFTFSFDSDVPIGQLRAIDPLDREPVVDYDSQKFQVPVYEDLNGYAIVNSAFDAFESVVMVDSAFEIMSIQVNHPTSDYIDVGMYMNTLNDSDWSITLATGEVKTIPKWAGKIDNIARKQKEENGQVFWDWQYKILINKGLWFPYKITDAGYNFLDDAGKPQPILSGIETTSKPRLLDGSGNALPLPIELGDQVQLEFDIYEDTDWSSLP
jgi:hypothetical protein